MVQKPPQPGAPGNTAKLQVQRHHDIHKGVTVLALSSHTWDLLADLLRSADWQQRAALSDIFIKDLDDKAARSQQVPR